MDAHLNMEQMKNLIENLEKPKCNFFLKFLDKKSANNIMKKLIKHAQQKKKL